MSPSPFNETIIAPCGMNCGVCRAYLREKNRCGGCNDPGRIRQKSCENCRLRLCDQRTGAFCSACAEYPCTRLRHLDERYRTRYGMSEIENLEYIRDRGIGQFLENEERRWVSEDGVLCVHDGRRYLVRRNKSTPSS